MVEWEHLMNGVIALDQQLLYGIIAGSLATLLGVIVTFLFTIMLEKRKKRKRENQIWYAVREEITSNYCFSIESIQSITKEIERLEDDGGYTFEPSLEFQTSFFGLLIKSNLPRNVTKDLKLLNNLRILSQILVRLNKVNHHKETFKLKAISHESEFRKNMLLQYNNSIKDLLNDAKEIMDTYYYEIIILEKNQEKEMKKL